MNTDSANTATHTVAGEEPQAGEDAKFAAAIGLTPPAGGVGSKWSLRRKERPDTSGRPLVTAETASLAAAAVGARNSTIGPIPSGDDTSTAADLARARVGEPTGPVPTISEPAPMVREAPLAAAPRATQHPLVGVTAAPNKESTPLAWWRRRRMRVRRVRRTIRHIDPWSIFKVSIILFACMYVAAMAAGVLLWSAAVESGIVDRLESFVEDVGVFETFEVDGETIFRGASIVGVVLVAAGAALSVVFTILFNLISDLMGGIRFTMIEEETAVRRRRLRAGEEVVPTDKVGRRRSDPGVGQNDDG